MLTARGPNVSYRLPLARNDRRPMNVSDRWSRVEALYHAARGRDADERAAFSMARVGQTPSCGPK